MEIEKNDRMVILRTEEGQEIVASHVQAHIVRTGDATRCTVQVKGRSKVEDRFIGYSFSFDMERASAR